MKNKSILRIVVLGLLFILFMPSHIIVEAKDITVYSQTNTNWSSISYGKGPEGKATTLGPAGCGVFAYINAIYYLNNQFIEPSILAQYSVNNGHRIDGQGTSETLYPAFANSKGSLYGFQYDTRVKNVTAARPYLENGDTGVLHVQGHWVALVDYNSSNKQYLVLDSYKSANRGTSKTGYRWMTSSEFTGKMALSGDYSVYLFKSNSSSGTTPVVTPDNKTGYYKVSTQSGSSLMLRNGPNTSGTTIRAKIPNGTQIAVTETTNSGWGKTTYGSEEGWVCLDYCTYVGNLTNQNLNTNRIIIDGVDIGYSSGDRYTGAGQCRGYARYCQNQYYGYNPDDGVHGNLFATQKNIKDLNTLKMFCSISPCAHIRTTEDHPHSMIVISTTESSVTITDANIPDNNTIRKVVYSWNDLWDVLTNHFNGVQYVCYWNGTGLESQTQGQTNDTIVHIDGVTKNNSTGVTISGWIGSKTAVSYLMGEVSGVKQYNLTSSLSSDSGVAGYLNQMYGTGVYPYASRFRIAIPAGDLKSNSSYTFTVFGALKSGAGVEQKSCSFTTTALSGGSSGSSGSGSSGTVSTHPHILHVDSPSGSYDGSNNIEVSGWIASNKAVSYVMAEIPGVKQFNLTNISDDAAVKQANLNQYTYNKRFRGAISLDLLTSNTTYSCKIWVGFTDSTVTEVYETSFRVGNIVSASEKALAQDCDYAVKIDNPTGTFDGYNNVEISGWIVTNQDINHLMVEWTNGSQGGQQNLTSTLVHAEDVYENAKVQYGDGAFSHTQRFHGVIPLSQLKGNSDYTFKVWAGLADGRVTGVTTSSFHMNDIPTGIKKPVMGFDTPIANGSYSELLDVSGWIVSDSPVMYLQSQVNNSQGTRVKEIQNISYTEDSSVLKNYSTFKYGYRFTGQFQTNALAGGTYTVLAWCGDDEGNRTDISRNFTLTEMSNLDTTDYYLHLDNPTEGGTYSSNFEITGWIGANAPITYALFQVDGAYQNSLATERATDVEEHLQAMGKNYTYVRRFRGVVEPWRLSAGTAYTVRTWFGLGRTGMTDSDRCKAGFNTAGTIIRDTYTIKYDAMGGTGAPSSQTKVCGQDLTLSSTVPVKLGYTFKGWNTHYGSVKSINYSPGSTFTENTPATMYAIWEEGGLIDGDVQTIEKEVKIEQKGTYRYFSFTPKETSNYRFDTAGDQKTQIKLFDSDGKQLTEKSNSNGNVSVAADLEAEKTYWLCCGIYNNASTGTYTVSVRRGYKVTFDANTGTGGPEDTYYQYYGEPLSIPETVPSKTMHLTYDAAGGSVSSESMEVSAVFDGWCTASSGSSEIYDPGEDYEENDPATLYAMWSYPCGITLEQPLQEGKTFVGWLSECGEIVDEDYYVESDETLTAVWIDTVIKAKTMQINPNSLTISVGDEEQLSVNCTPENAEVPLIHWVSSNPDSVTVSEDGMVTAVDNGAALISAVTSNGSIRPSMTVMAGSMDFTVTYDANGGKQAPESCTVHYGDAYSVSDNAPVRTGHTFMGWTDEADSIEVMWQPGEALNVEKNMTLYAVWKPDVFVIQYDANGGNQCYPVEQEKLYGVDAILSDTDPEKEGFVFAGWAESSDSMQIDYLPGAEYKENRDITLYAVWYSPAESMTLNYSSLAMSVGGEKRLRPISEPDGSAVGSVEWNSSKEEVVTVDGGIVKAVAAGKAVITCTSINNPEITATCQITVADSAVQPSGEMDAPTTEIIDAQPGQTVTVKVNFRTSDAAYVKLLISYDQSALKLDRIDAVGTHVTAGSQALVMAVSNGRIPDGSQANLTFTVLDGAEPGLYSIDTVVTECYTIDEEDTTQFAVAADTVRVLCSEHTLSMISPEPADENHDGLSAGWKCDVCGKIVVEQETIEKSSCFNLPVSVQEIGEEAFMSTTAKQVTLSENVTRIGDAAFKNCPNLRIIIIPETVNEFGNNIFDGCNNLVIITPEGSSAEQYADENEIPCFTE